MKMKKIRVFGLLVSAVVLCTSMNTYFDSVLPTNKRRYRE